MAGSAPVEQAFRPLGSRCFSDADQQAFAKASGDFNPMHVDAIAARRLLSGRQVVHGVHVLLEALNRWRPVTSCRPNSLRCSFDHPVSVGDEVEFRQRDDAAGETVLQACVGGVVCADIRISMLALANIALARPPAAMDAKRDVTGLEHPLDEAPGSQADTTFFLRPSVTDWWAQAFPVASDSLSTEILASLAALSNFVGMVCPGEHSVFSSLSVALHQTVPDGEPLTMQLRRFDPRFKLFMIACTGPLTGEIRAFLRPPPQQQPSTLALAPHIRHDEFRGTRSLVVGGSRGLGELAAKIIAAGGGDVVITYASGRSDAERVADDISAHGHGRCELMPADLSDPAWTGIVNAGPGWTAVYFFATPRIYRTRAEIFDHAAFEDLFHFYVVQFRAMCRMLERRAGLPPVRVYFPSTVFIDERPKGMTEYAMAKAAAEILADDLNRQQKAVRIIHTRLPRMATDQTSSVMGVEVASSVDVLVPVIRQVTGLG